MFRQNTALDARVGTVGLRVERQDIWFHSVNATDVRIAVTVHNDRASYSAPTTMELEAAPLGAFLPWTPLGSVDVPAIPPGEALIIETVAKRSNTAPDRSNWPGSWDSEEPADRREYERLSRPLRSDSVLPETRFTSMMGPMWVGNVNVFIGETAVERHLAERLAIVPGGTNKAMFFVGAGPDAYMLRTKDVPSDWGVRIYVRDEERRNERLGCSNDMIRLGEWWEILHGGIAYLHLDIPLGYLSGGVTVDVTQRSTNKTAFVEFEFE